MSGVVSGDDWTVAVFVGGHDGAGRSGTIGWRGLTVGASAQGSQARAYGSAGFAPTFSSSDEPMVLVTLDALSSFSASFVI